MLAPKAKRVLGFQFKAVAVAENISDKPCSSKAGASSLMLLPALLAELLYICSSGNSEPWVTT